MVASKSGSNNSEKTKSGSNSSEGTKEEKETTKEKLDSLQKAIKPGTRFVQLIIIDGYFFAQDSLRYRLNGRLTADA